MTWKHSFFLLALCGSAWGASCSNDDVSAPFADSFAALDQADQAFAAKDYAAAQAGFQFALTHGQASLQGDALVGLFGVALQNNEEEVALEYFERLHRDFSSTLDGDLVFALVNQAADASFPALASTLLGYAFDSYPERKTELLAANRRIEKLRSEAPVGDSGTAELGYVGGEEEEIPPLTPEELKKLQELGGYMNE